MIPQTPPSLTHKKKCYLWIIPFVVFVFMFVFYTKIHPVIIFDTDDWHYNAFARHPIPIWRDWNPTRVLAEVLMPIVSFIGSILIYPINHDFIISNIIAHAIVISIFIAIYIRFFYNYIVLFFHDEGNNFKALFTTLLFFICHFLIFRSQLEFNTHMFIANDQCVFYYYVIPNMINSSLALHFLARKHPNSESKQYQEFSPGYIVALYFAAFSNLYASCIYAAVLGVYFIYDFFVLVKNRNSISEFIKQHWDSVTFLIVWLTVQIFEMNGMRAASLKKEEGILYLFKEQSIHLYDLFKSINHAFLVGSIIILFLFISVMISTGCWKKITSFLLITLSAELPVTIYIILISSQQALGGIKRPEISFGIFLLGLIIIFSMLALIINKLRIIKSLLPLLCILSVLETNTTYITFRENNYKNIPYTTVYTMDNDIVNQVVRADMANQDHVDIFVPKFNDGDNFPMANYGGDFISCTLRKNGITKSHITISLIPSDERKSELGIG